MEEWIPIFAPHIPYIAPNNTVYFTFSFIPSFLTNNQQSLGGGDRMRWLEEKENEGRWLEEARV